MLTKLEDLVDLIDRWQDGTGLQNAHLVGQSLYGTTIQWMSSLLDVDGPVNRLHDLITALSVRHWSYQPENRRSAFGHARS